jgi:hypothetical protein
MPQHPSSQPAIGSKTIVVSLETTSVETRREAPQSCCSCLENHGGRRDASGNSPARQKNRWSYYVFCQELRTLLERGREKAVRVGGTSFLL